MFPKYISTSALVLIASSFLLTGCQNSGNIESSNDTASTTSGATQKSAGLDFFSGKTKKLVFGGSLIEKIRRENISDQKIIFKIGNESVNVSDFKTAFKSMQAQMKLLLNQTPGMEQKMVEQAQRLNITLTPEEKVKLVTMARAKGGANLEKVLKEQNISQEEFDKQVLQMGLALKVISSTVEQSVLNQLISKCLLIDGAYEAGLSKTAFNTLVDYKMSPQYKVLLKESDSTPAQLKEQILKEGLAQAMQERILQDLRVTDKDVFDFYNSEKERFNGQGMMRWSQIFIASPKAEMNRNPQIIVMIKANNPKITDAEIEKRITDGDLSQQKKALLDLRKVLTGADFAALANEDTNDRDAKEAQSGGDMGYMSEKELESNEVFAPIHKALAALQPGQVYPELIQSPYGWHIVKLISKPETSVPFSEIKDGLKTFLIKESKPVFIQKWISQREESKNLDVAKDFSDCLSFSQS